MIDVKALESKEPFRENKTYFEIYSESLKNRGENPTILDVLLVSNGKRKNLISKKESLRAEQNRVGEEIAKLKRNKADATAELTKMQDFSSQIKEMEVQIEEIENDLNHRLSALPNLCDASVPIGASEVDNQVVRQWGKLPQFDFKPKEHWELGENLEILDFLRGGKVAGARFAFLRREASMLERALVQFMIAVHTTENGFEEIMSPFVVNSAALYGTGQFPKFRDDVFHLQDTDYHLIPTAEVPVTNFFAGEVLREADLPKAFCAYSPCFRSEAGSYGRDTKGLIRQHQFNKVEMVVFSHPDRSYEAHEQMVRSAESILQKLDLPYRVVSLCTKDIGFAAAKCYDLEVWLAGQGKYREISSCSNCEDFQARRAQIRFKPEGPKAKPQYVHTLNGSGLAVGRTLIAILENGQREDGSVAIPKALWPYTGGVTEIRR